MNTLSKTDSIIINALPARFTKKDAEKVFTELSLSIRYFEVFTRKKCFNKHFNRIFHGVYEKV